MTKKELLEYVPIHMPAIWVEVKHTEGLVDLLRYWSGELVHGYEQARALLYGEIKSIMIKMQKDMHFIEYNRVVLKFHIMCAFDDMAYIFKTDIGVAVPLEFLVAKVKEEYKLFDYD